VIKCTGFSTIPGILGVPQKNKFWKFWVVGGMFAQRFTATVATESLTHT
jgi:hypothetical protein